MSTPDRRVAVLIGLVVVALAVPYGVLGPGFLREDWQALRNARLLGAWHAAAGNADGSRPLGGPVFALVFGVLGHWPLAIYALLTVINAVAAVLVYLLGRLFVDRWAAAAIALVWAVLPTHSSTSRWASTAHATAALAFLLWGALLLVRDRRHQRVPWAAGAVVLVASLLYEAVLVPGLAMFVAAWAASPRRAWRDMAPALLLVPAGLWALLRSPKPAPHLVRLSDIVSSNVGWGVNDAEPLWRVVQLLVLAGAALAVGRLMAPSFRSSTAWPERAVVAGIAIVVLGAAPFVGYAQDIDFVAQGDRANLVAAIGAAVVFVGLAGMLPPRVRIAGAIVLVALCLPTRVGQDRDWSETARDVEAVLDAMDHRLPARPLPRPVVLGPTPISHGGVEGLENSWDATMALQATRTDRRWRVQYVYESVQLTGPYAFDVRQRASSGP